MRTAVLLVGYNRLDYFRQVFDSLVACPESARLDLFVILDGGAGAAQPELRELVEQCGPPGTTVVVRESNWGVGRNLIGARRHLFDVLGYDRVFVLEDDLVLNPHYLTVILALSDWAHAHDDIGTVMAQTLTTADRELQASRRKDVVVTNRHFWGYAITRSVWDRIKGHLYEFEARFLSDRLYDLRPHEEIRRWITDLCRETPRVAERPLLDVPEEIRVPPFTLPLSECPTGQDAATAVALWREGYWRLTTRVPRARYIGVNGVHFSAEVYSAHGFDTQEVFSFEDDERPGPFVLVHEDEDGRLLIPTEYR